MAPYSSSLDEAGEELEDVSFSADNNIPKSKKPRKAPRKTTGKKKTKQTEGEKVVKKQQLKQRR
jgi:hypothetical protein